jgi:hypothetical protein
LSDDRVTGLLYVTLAFFILFSCVGGAIYYAWYFT